ncbi:N-acetylneuraminate synthase family protein [Prochlorococcus marinus]|nr:N-acetylneuraminate synthase family protein [Prochlorococcus marinus]
MNIKTFDFNNLFVFDLANNHQGDVNHALKIIKNIGQLCKKNRIRGVFKFQYRQLDSFIHPSHKENSDNKHINRFLSTKLNQNDFQLLFDEAKKYDLLTMCTPFDEESVEIITKMGFDLIKLASCSAKDWPLLEKFPESGLPIIFSTGGLSISGIDDLVSFFTHQGCEFAIMHCISIYPIPENNFYLDQIDFLKKRYPDRVIGWSTHEDPDDTCPISIAVAKGAKIFERHVGIETDNIKLNSYSSTPEQLQKWITAYKKAVNLCGVKKLEGRPSLEVESIDLLSRGVYAKENIKAGTTLKRSQVFFAMPYEEGQLKSGEWKEGIKTTDEIRLNNSVKYKNISIPEKLKMQVLKSAVHEVKALLNQAQIKLNSEFEVEYSHHYGIENFKEFGVVIINCINREYCKKLLIQLPGQKHPYHHHRLKEETFQVLYGEMTIHIDDHTRVLRPGDTCLVLPGVWHSFSTEIGAIVEEVSTTHFNNDSIYKDKKIQKMKRDERKTTVDHWGRYQIPSSK